MVFYFTIPEGFVVYMGKDKHENEDLIKFAWREDVWFHVDNVSSAHVYLRLKEEFTSFDQIPDTVLEKMLQLTKENSIEGSKKHSVDIVITPASNLQKTSNMDVGAVSYHNNKLTKIVKNVVKDKEILKAILKTKREEFPDLAKLRTENEDLKRKQIKNEILEERLKKEKEEKEKKEAIQNLKDQRDNFNSLINTTPSPNMDDDFL